MCIRDSYSWEELREEAPVYLPVEYYKYKTGKMRNDGQPGFQTATGRIELWSTFYNAAELDPLPYFEEPDPGPGSTPELFEQYPVSYTHLSPAPSSRSASPASPCRRAWPW